MQSILDRCDVLAGTGILDDRLLTLERECREAAPDLRAVGHVVDRDPDAIAGLLHLRGVQLQQSFFSLGESLGDSPGDCQPGEGQDAESSCRARVVAQERLSYGDPGTILASPGPSLSGVAVATLGDSDQRRNYFGRLTEKPTWTFFALTEPSKGSAAMELETSLTVLPGGEGWLLNGEKCYVGNGARAQMGVVFCRRSPGPWGIEAVLLDAGDPGFAGELLPMVGLRGARISRLRFTDVPIPPERVLGRHLPPSRRGLFGALQTLLRFRPTLAAMALGVAEAACDYILEHRPDLPPAERWNFEALVERVLTQRRLVYEVAADVDRGTVNPARIGAVKLRAARLAEDATLLAADVLGPTSLIDHPWLEKTYRDARAFEFMEGTSDLHRLGVFQGLVKQTFFRKPDSLGLQP
jgi:alkylation response protein AidB-like acyl-CoA dehydrogenase